MSLIFLVISCFYVYMYLMKNIVVYLYIKIRRNIDIYVDL